MLGSGYFMRLAAALCAAALMGAAIQYPGAARNASARIAAAFAAAETPYAQRACAIGEPAFDGPFAPLEDVLSVSPLGGVTAPGEILPAPYIRINTRRPDETFGRRDTYALAPARADIVALERRIERDEAGRPRAQSWTAHFRVCDKISFYYDRLDRVSETLLKRAGGLEAFAELGGPDHIALETRIRVNRGDIIGVADGFDVALHDRAAPPARLERPERYSANPYARAAIFDVAASLVKTITPDTSQARCPIDYLPKDEQSAWADKLGDSWGIRRAKGDDACRTALADLPGAAQGVWYTDAAHNAATTKVSAIALSPDAIDPGRLVFALHGRLASLKPAMIGLAPFMEEERAAAARDFITAESRAPGSRDGAERRVNAPFAEIRDGAVYCYQGLRANFIGPAINGVFLLERQSGDEGPALLKIEARGDAAACADLPAPWAFTGNETTFYR